MRYLLDTCACIHLIRGRRKETVAALRKYPVGACAISVVTLAELEYGAAKSVDPQRNRLVLAQLSATLEVLPFEAPAAAAYGVIRADLERRGCVIGGNDLLIAAHALSAGLELVTSNQAEFMRVSGLKVHALP